MDFYPLNEAELEDDKPPAIIYTVCCITIAWIAAISNLLRRERWNKTDSLMESYPMKLDISTVIILFVISLFCGVIIVAIGLGAAFPVINRVATPFACNGQLQLSTDTYSYQPGEQTTTITWFCVDEKTGAKEDVSWKTILAAGLVYSLLIFAAFILRWLMVNRPGQNSSHGVSVSAPPAFPRAGNFAEGALKRLTELKQMHDSNLITDQEYEKKKAEILKEL